MRTWIKAILGVHGALTDMREHLDALAQEEDRLSKAETTEQLHYQRGKVAGIKAVLYLVTSAHK